MALWLGRVALSVGVQSRGSNGVDPTWLGFAYGSWLPRLRFRWPGGKLIRGHSGYWLCFHWAIDVWPRSHRVNHWGVH